MSSEGYAPNQSCACPCMANGGPRVECGTCSGRGRFFPAADENSYDPQKHPFNVRLHDLQEAITGKRFAPPMTETAAWNHYLQDVRDMDAKVDELLEQNAQMVRDIVEAWTCLGYPTSKQISDASRILERWVPEHEIGPVHG